MLLGRPTYKSEGYQLKKQVSAFSGRLSKVYHRFGHSPNYILHSDISPTPYFTGERGKKCEIWPQFLILLAFELPAFRNEAKCPKSSCNKLVSSDYGLMSSPKFGTVHNTQL